MEFDLAEAYEKYRDELVRFASGVVGPWLAEDAVSAAVGRLTARRGTSLGVEHARAFLYRCVFNQAVSMRRSSQRRLAREHAAARRGDIVRESTVSLEVLDAMSRLSVRQRAVIFLTYWSELESSAVAVRLGTSVRTVERELNRARQSLGEMLR